MVAVFVLVGMVIAVVVWRGRRRRTLAGLNADRPAFHVEPPGRRMSKRKHEAL